MPKATPINMDTTTIETYPPVVTHNTLRTFLNASVYKNLKITHLDVKTAFLHGEFDEEVYMT